MFAPASAVEEEREVAVFDTRLANECESEFAVATNWDCRPFGVWLAAVFAVVASVFSRRRMPPTAYWTGNVKYEEARWGGLGGGDDDLGPSVVEGIAWTGTLGLQWDCSCKQKAGRVRLRLCWCSSLTRRWRLRRVTLRNS